MFDNKIIAMNYCAVEKVASILWEREQTKSRKRSNITTFTMKIHVTF